jgi:nicotinate-nucleotide adenylyltransferase
MGRAMLRLGVMGGTFDPPHMAHLIMAEIALSEYKLDRVLFIPAGTPPHKVNSDITDAEDRYAMTLLSIASNPNFYITRMEIERKGPSYSVDTIRELKEIYGSGTDIYFILGMDEALDITSWHEAEQLPSLTQFIIAPRPGFDESDIKKRVPNAFGNVFNMLSMQPIYIASTDIRNLVERSISVRYLVPETVNEYILKHKLYKGE